MKVIGFVGSPRAKGNTATLVEEVLRGAQENGAETKIFNLNQLNIKGCQSCYKCQTPGGKCVQKDDMASLYDEIYSADAIVIGSPVYMLQVTGQTKILIDRFYAFMYPASDKPMGFGLKLPAKKTVTVYTQGQPDPTSFESYFKHTEGLLNFIGFNVKERIVAGGTKKAKDMQANTQIMNKAYNAGKMLAL